MCAKTLAAQGFPDVHGTGRVAQVGYFVHATRMFAVDLTRAVTPVTMRAAMRSTLRTEDSARLSALVTRDGVDAVAVHAGCSANTIRSALRGARLQGPTVRAILGTLTTLEGAPAHRQAA